MTSTALFQTPLDQLSLSVPRFSARRSAKASSPESVPALTSAVTPAPAVAPVLDAAPDVAVDLTPARARFKRLVVFTGQIS